MLLNINNKITSIYFKLNEKKEKKKERGNWSVLRESLVEPPLFKISLIDLPSRCNLSLSSPLVIAIF